jgi:hypothetical protein
MNKSVSDSRKAREIVQHILPLIEKFTFDKDGAGLVLYEQDRETWYSLTYASIRAICWSKYRHEPRSSGAVREAVRLLTVQARRESRSAA